MLHLHGITSKKPNLKICYPVKIQTEATEWSCEHEKHAVDKDVSLMWEII